MFGEPVIFQKFSEFPTFDEEEPRFELMHSRLSYLRPQPFGLMHGHLQSVHDLIAIILCAKETGMDSRDELKSLAVILSAEAYAEKVWELIHQEIPLTDSTDEFMPDLVGLNALMWDDADEIIQNPGGHESLFVFLTFCLGGEFAERSQWDEARIAFDWPEFEPIVLTPADFDEQAAVDCLNKRNASDLVGALEVGFFPPDTVFFNENPEDGSWCGLEISGENLEYLQDEWEESKPVCDRYTIATEAVDGDPNRLLDLIAAMDAGHMISHEPREEGEGTNEDDD